MRRRALGGLPFEDVTPGRAIAVALLLLPALAAAQVRVGETTGSVCFARGSAVLTDEAKSGISHIVGIQTIDLHAIAVEAYGDPGDAGVARRRAEAVRNFLSDALEIETARIRVKGKPHSAWPGTWGRTVFKGGLAKLPCAGTKQTPAPVIVQLSGICKPGNCFRMVCGESGCWGRRD
jgi:hypothetical protein